MGAEQFGDWRARRIRTMLDAHPKHDRSSFAAMQVDVVSDFAHEVLPAMLATAPIDAASERVLALLRGWDGSMRMDLPQPLVLQRLDPPLPRRPPRRSRHPRRARLAPPSTSSATPSLRGGAVLCNGDCTPLLSRSLAETAAALPAGWEHQEWGTVHQATFAHPLLGNLPLVGAAATWSIPQPGDDGTVFRGAMRAPGYASLHGPAYRGVYDLSDLDASLFGLAPGETGNPFSPDAAITLQRWRDGVPIRLGAAPEAVDGTIESAALKNDPEPVKCDDRALTRSPAFENMGTWNAECMTYKPPRRPQFFYTTAPLPCPLRGGPDRAQGRHRDHRARGRAPA